MNNKEFVKQDYVKEELRRRFTYNPNSGELIWKFRGEYYFDSKYAGKIASKTYTQKCGYTSKRVSFEYSKRKLHISAARLVWMLHYGDWPKHTIDHINGNSLDDRIENLRDVTQFDNNQNKRAYKCNKNGFKGVYERKTGYLAIFTTDHVSYRLGIHGTAEEAARAYDKKAKELLGDFAVLNFPDEDFS